MDRIYLKGEDWWTYSATQESSWYWRKICSVRDKVEVGYVQNRWLLQSSYKWLRGGAQILCQWSRWAERIDYLFYECPFSKSRLERILKWLGIYIINREDQGLWRRISIAVQDRTSRGFVLATLTYFIRRGRNEALWHHKVPLPIKVVSKSKLNVNIEWQWLWYDVRMTEIGDGYIEDLYSIRFNV